ncbi:aminotransferase class IV [Robiginitalea sp. M366]|uniref:aminotransferase class IV n=1 Tax=Robiginitalea aestuariiviva TaxID=3036903 RepID=UPI00240DB46F|nr:aminotransferase class IV [Robiginitalea aestuariiviva]MDG1572768.1 aminotransferase class IV [Robiginitalea aestuariiviva]
MVNFNGDLLPDTAHFLNHENRALRFGDALTETVRYTGQSLLFWEAHYFQMMAALRQLRMDIPMAFTMEYLEEEIRKTLKANALEAVPARVDLMGIRSNAGGVDLLIQVQRLETAGFVTTSQAVRADLYKDYLLPAGGLSTLPHNNRLLEVLAGIYTQENGWDTCLLLNDRKEVVRSLEGPLFLRVGDQIRTPGLAGGSPDTVLRRQLLEWGKTDTHYQWEEAPISPFDLQKADELFSIHPVLGLCSITDYRKAHFNTKAATHATTVLNEKAGVN